MPAFRIVTLPEELRIDLVARDYLGSVKALEVLLADNPGLAEHGMFVPEGTRLQIREAEPAPTLVPTVYPWE